MGYIEDIATILDDIRYRGEVIVNSITGAHKTLNEYEQLPRPHVDRPLTYKPYSHGILLYDSGKLIGAIQRTISYDCISYTIFLYDTNEIWTTPTYTHDHFESAQQRLEEILQELCIRIKNK